MRMGSGDMRAVLIVLLLLVAGCATREERLAGFRNECSAYGYVTGTTQFADCVMGLADRDRARRRALAEAGANLGKAATTRPPIEVPKQNTTDCVPTGGGGVRCTSY
jgi:hypothetical protein